MTIERFQNVLVLAPHTDDGEFGCGGTMARLNESGVKVTYAAFSTAAKSVPEGFPKDVLKHEVRAMARELGVPARIIDRQPSAGLWEGQTDESEMGMTYQELDTYLASGEGSPVVAGLVETMRRQSAHKRSLPPIFPR